MIHKKDIPLISHAQAAEIDRKIEEDYGGGAIFPPKDSSLYAAYRNKGNLHVVQTYCYDAEGNEHVSISNLGLYLDYKKDIYHITLNLSDAHYSFSNFVQNKVGIMTRQQKLARISMAKTRLSDIFKVIDYGEPTKNFN